MQVSKRLTRKQVLYQFLAENDFFPSDSKLEEFVSNHPWVRVKGLGSKSTTVINLSEKDGWYDPHSWAINYRNNMINRLQQVVDECLGIIPPDQIQVLCQPFGNEVSAVPVVCTPSDNEFEIIQYTYNVFKETIPQDKLDTPLTLRMRKILKYLLRNVTYNGEELVEDADVHTYRDWMEAAYKYVLNED